ncbi:CpsD/CapB family tyrosine-protein kinase [uncultured Clostridium sp.]|uniref:CpsD/CapB family tyrosine-protein kinase n=1 Tax=uncultured Clostridium sp. TaxID=59620 RepID=UPI0025D929D8|nr:CpsD/CapB family tyrosine-protein kinase [uncultured Clostridium sp.]
MLFKRKMENTINKEKNIGFIVEDKPKSIEAESYRTLRTNIQYSSFDKKIRIIAVTSAEAMEGKSTVAGNLAISFAQNEESVILLDCDLRKPSLHKKFGISNLIGLSEVLIGDVSLEDAVQFRNNNLDILTSGKVPPNPSEMLSSSAMSVLLEKLKESYDVIILDSAPILAVTDPQILSVKADGTVLVVRAEKTKRECVIEATNLLKKVDANIIGVILNRIEGNRGKYYSYYGSDLNKKERSYKKRKKRNLNDRHTFSHNT